MSDDRGHGHDVKLKLQRWCEEEAASTDADHHTTVALGVFLDGRPLTGTEGELSLSMGSPPDFLMLEFHGVKKPGWIPDGDLVEPVGRAPARLAVRSLTIEWE